MFLKDWLCKVRALAEDTPPTPPELPPEPVEPTGEEIVPRWTDGQIVTEANLVLLGLSVNVPRLFQTRLGYAWNNEILIIPADDDFFDMRRLGVAVLPDALSYMTASRLLASVKDNHSADASAAQAKIATELIAGYV